jgi:protein required for attachment to host cells
MAGTWIVVAHRAGARIFENRGRDTGLVLVQQLTNEAGRLKNSEIDTDKQGSSGHSSNPGRNALTREESAQERAAADFARELSHTLTRGRNDNAYSDVVLVAEPGFLGLLRESLDAPTASMIRAEVPKNLAKVDVHALAPHLSEAVRL